MLTSCDAEAAAGAAVLFDDERVRQFHDPDRRAGHAFAPLMGLDPMSAIAARLGVAPEQLLDTFQEGFVRGPASAFDTVFAFGAESAWSDGGPPAPLAWATQLDPDTYTGPDRERWFWAEDLDRELAQLADELLRAPADDDSAGRPEDEGGR